MSIILATGDGRRLQVNVWNWGVLHHAVAAAALLPEEVWAPKRYNGGGHLDATQVVKLADFLESQVLPCLEVGERLLFDGTTTAEPDDGTFYRDEHELWKNYSLRHDVLVKIIDLLRSARGAVSFY